MLFDPRGTTPNTVILNTRSDPERQAEIAALAWIDDHS